MIERIRHLRTKLGQRQGITSQQGCVIFCVAALLVFSRCPSLILHPQFYGEDGTYWYAQAYEAGWLHSLAIPCQGYLNTLQRFGAGMSLWVPFRYAPLCMAVLGLVMQCIPVLVLLSSRCRDWGPLSLRVLWAAFYIALPNTLEIHVVLTNSQWHMLLVLLLVGFGRPPSNWAWKLFDIACFSLVGLSGPFCLILLPLLLAYWYKRRYRWTLVQTGIIAVCSVVEGWFLLYFNNRLTIPLGVNFKRTVRIIGGDIVGGTLLGGDHRAALAPLVFLFPAALFGMFVVGYVLRKANLQLRLLVSFALLLLAGSLKSPMINGSPRWDALVFIQFSRYWFYPTLIFIWCVAWCWKNARSPSLRIISAIWLCCSIVGVVTGWVLKPYPDFDFPKYAEQFEAASPGTVMIIPVAPASYYHMTIRKK